MADANQAWSLDAALAFANTADATGLAWLEEPLAHDAPDADWCRLAERLATPLAAGENFAAAADFEDLPARRGVGVLQPDVGKWGGIANSLAVAASARRRNLLFCPHWLGGGVGLLASMHVKAATGGDTGYVEVDFNANPMRAHLAAAALSDLASGRIRLRSSGLGIGIEDDAIAPFEGNLVLEHEYVLSR